MRELARHLGRVARAPTRIYLTGGASAVLEGWRGSTTDVDLRFEPEVDELLRELPELKEHLGVNIELASPPDFIPELPGWRERSPLVFQESNIYVHHFDFYSQALSKIERGFQQDLDDVQKMIDSGLVEPARLREALRGDRARSISLPGDRPVRIPAEARRGAGRAFVEARCRSRIFSRGGFDERARTHSAGASNHRHDARSLRDRGCCSPGAVVPATLPPVARPLTQVCRALKSNRAPTNSGASR